MGYQLAWHFKGFDMVKDRSTKQEIYIVWQIVLYFTIYYNQTA